MCACASALKVQCQNAHACRFLYFKYVLPAGHVQADVGIASFPRFLSRKQQPGNEADVEAISTVDGLVLEQSVI